jgi:hypothetical protein
MAKKIQPLQFVAKIGSGKRSKCTFYDPTERIHFDVVKYLKGNLRIIPEVFLDISECARLAKRLLNKNSQAEHVIAEEYLEIYGEKVPKLKKVCFELNERRIKVTRSTTINDIVNQYYSE